MKKVISVALMILFLGQVSFLPHKKRKLPWPQMIKSHRRR